MIEVRIPRNVQVEYASSEAFAGYVQGRLIAAGMPLKDGEEFGMTTDGILQYMGPDPLTDCYVYRWYDKSELPPDGAKPS